MKIGIDARIYQTGIGRYVQNLIRELEKLGPSGADQPQDKFVVFLRGTDFDRYQPGAANFSKTKADCPPYSFKEQILMPFILARSRVDLVHFTNFNVPILWWGRYVLTIHDLIHQQHSTFGSTTRNKLYYLFKKLVYLLVIRFAAFRALKIIVPSNDVKNDLIKYLWVKPEKIVVTYEGLDEKLKTTTRSPKIILKKYGISEPYLLYVATMYPHKNHRRLIEAFGRLIEGGGWKVEKQAPNQSHLHPPIPNLQLVLVGKMDYFSKQLKAWVEQKGLARKVIFPNFNAPDGYVPDEDLAVFYQNAAAYVFPSLKEGFGIPILEAWQFEVPVTAASASSLPEVGGDAVLYFNPLNVADITDKIRQILTDKKLRRFLAQKGRLRLQQFSWQKMAKQTLQVYDFR